MRIITTSVLLIGVLAIPMATAAPALAGTNAVSRHYETGDPSCSNLRSTAKFFHSGDKVTAGDNCADGWGAQAETLIVDTGNHKLCYNGSGAGTTKTCNYNFGEGRVGVILAMSVDNGHFRGSGNQAAFVA